MFYDVSVSRIQTATKIIRVEADAPDTAREKALNAAGDEDFGCCVTEYDFDANDVSEVIDPSVPRHSMNVQTDTCEKCVLCGSVMPADMDAAIDQGWTPDFWDGETHCEGPVCPTCVEKYLKQDRDGEPVLKTLKGEYVSVWGNGHEFHSPCIVSIRTRTVKVLLTYEMDMGAENLDREYVVLDGKEYEACPARLRNEYSPEEQARMFFCE